MRQWMISAWFVIVLIAIGLTAWQGHKNAQRITSLVASQLDNRVKNVGTWCNAINADRDTARARAVENHLTPYTLPNLNCVKLERTTAASSK